MSDLSSEVVNGDKKQCNQCGMWYKGLAQHWIQNKQCNYPQLPNPIMDFSIAAYMAGGDHKTDEDSARIRVRMIDQEKANSIRNYLGLFGTTVTSEQRKDLSSGEEITMYIVNTMRHKQFQIRNMDLKKVSDKDYVLKIIAYISGRLETIEWKRGWWNR